LNCVDPQPTDLVLFTASILVHPAPQITDGVQKSEPKYWREAKGVAAGKYFAKQGIHAASITAIHDFGLWSEIQTFMSTSMRMVGVIPTVSLHIQVKIEIVKQFRYVPLPGVDLEGGERAILDRVEKMDTTLSSDFAVTTSDGKQHRARKSWLCLNSPYIHDQAGGRSDIALSLSSGTWAAIYEWMKDPLWMKRQVDGFTTFCAPTPVRTMAPCAPLPTRKAASPRPLDATDSTESEPDSKPAARASAATVVATAVAIDTKRDGADIRDTINMEKVRELWDGACVLQMDSLKESIINKLIDSTDKGTVFNRIQFAKEAADVHRKTELYEKCFKVLLPIFGEPEFRARIHELPSDVQTKLWACQDERMDDELGIARGRPSSASPSSSPSPALLPLTRSGNARWQIDNVHLLSLQKDETVGSGEFSMAGARWKLQLWNFGDAENKGILDDEYWRIVLTNCESQNMEAKLHVASNIGCIFKHNQSFLGMGRVSFLSAISKKSLTLGYEPGTQTKLQIDVAAEIEHHDLPIMRSFSSLDKRERQIIEVLNGQDELMPADVKIRTNDGVSHDAHQFRLELMSKFFRDTLGRRGFLEVESKDVSLEMDSQMWIKIYHWMKTGHFTFADLFDSSRPLTPKVIEYFIAANFLGIEPLMSSILNFLVASTHRDNVIEHFQLAKEYEHLPDFGILRKKCLELLVSNREDGDLRKEILNRLPRDIQAEYWPAVAASTGIPKAISYPGEYSLDAIKVFGNLLGGAMSCSRFAVEPLPRSVSPAVPRPAPSAVPAPVPAVALAPSTLSTLPSAVPSALPPAATPAYHPTPMAALGRHPAPASVPAAALPVATPAYHPTPMAALGGHPAPASVPAAALPVAAPIYHPAVPPVGLPPGVTVIARPHATAGNGEHHNLTTFFAGNMVHAAAGDGFAIGQPTVPSSKGKSKNPLDQSIKALQRLVSEGNIDKAASQLKEIKKPLNLIGPLRHKPTRALIGFVLFGKVALDSESKRVRGLIANAFNAIYGTLLSKKEVAVTVQDQLSIANIILKLGQKVLQTEPYRILSLRTFLNSVSSLTEATERDKMEAKYLLETLNTSFPAAALSALSAGRSLSRGAGSEPGEGGGAGASAASGAGASGGGAGRTGEDSAGSDTGSHAGEDESSEE
jgi:hypothetical protein